MPAIEAAATAAKGSTAAASAAAAAGTTVASGLFSQLFAKRNMRLSVKANKELQDYAYQKDVNMWNLQNAYNTPQAQMDRLKEANLNPALMYGSGSSVGNTSGGSLPQYHAPTASMNAQAPDVAQGLQLYQDMQLRQAQIGNLKAQLDNINQDTANKVVDNALKALGVTKLNLENEYLPQNLLNRNTKGYFDTVQSQNQAEIGKYSLAMKQVDADLYSKIKQLQITALEKQINKTELGLDVSFQDLISKQIQNKFANARQWSNIIGTGLGTAVKTIAPFLPKIGKLGKISTNIQPATYTVHK